MKNKKRNKTYVVAAIVLSAVFLFVGCKNSTNKEFQTGPDLAEDKVSNNKDLTEGNDVTRENQDKANSDIPNENENKNENPVTDSQGIQSDKKDIYSHILAEYSDMVQHDFYAGLQGSDSYDSSFGKDIGLEIRTHKQDIYYALYDIDENGTMELIIAGGEKTESNPVFTPWNYDLYGYDGTNVVSIFPEMEFGYRTNFSLYANGVIKVFYSSSAAESGIDFYKIGDDGITPQLVDSFATIGHLEGEEAVFTYSQNGNEITEKEYNANIQNYEVPLPTELDWIQIQ